MKLTVDELAMLLGAAHIEIYALRKQLAEAQRRVEELTPKPEEKKDG